MSALKPSNSSNHFVFGRKNYTLMIAGIVVIIIGFILMIGGQPDDPNVFNAAEKYSFTRIILSPIVITLGLLVEIAAIWIKGKE